MRRFTITLAASLIICEFAIAANLTCRVDNNTDKWWCYRAPDLRSNGTTRAFKIYQGGEKNITNVGGFEGRVSCADNVVMEIRDRDGVVFARDAIVPGTAMWELRKDICKETKLKVDTRIRSF